MTHTIRGRYDEVNWFAEVFMDDRQLTPGESQHVRNHSPSGFAWGYAGSGPAQLALAILLRAGVEIKMALQYYQAFKSDFLVSLPREFFSFTVDIDAWLLQRIIG